jgi:signal transduction histidine kinase
MSSIVFLTNPRNEKIRWACLIGFFGGCGGLGTLLNTSLARPEWIFLLGGLFTSIGHYWTPYAILIFGLIYSDIIKTRKKKRLCKLLCLVPTIIMYIPFYYPFQLYPEFKTNYVILSFWTVPYVIISNILLIYSAWRETRPSIKRQRILTVLVVVPMVSFALTTDIILEALGIGGVWNYNPWMIAIQFLLFIYFATKYGILGVQIRVEKQRRDSTMKAVTSGTALLNHTIKNEIAKVDLLVNQLKEHIPLDKSSSERIALALNSTNHVLELSTRIQNKLDIMNLKESEFWISHSIDSSLSLLDPYLNSKINIIKQYEIDVKIYGDPVHIQETFLNIIKNAHESMENSGVILIKVYKTRRNVYVDIIDNGKGIEKDKLSLVLDPFYSTKGKLGNYGLGLTYCYNVIEKHGGGILIKSQVNQGTTITLSLPIKRIIDTKINQQSNSKSSGENSAWIKLS